jgi:hypothetical protein
VQIRDFDNYYDACDAVVEAGFTYLTDSNERSSSWTSAPTIRYGHPNGAQVEVLWNHDRGYLRWLRQPRDEHAA